MQVPVGVMVFDSCNWLFPPWSESQVTQGTRKGRVILDGKRLAEVSWVRGKARSALWGGLREYLLPVLTRWHQLTRAPEVRSQTGSPRTAREQVDSKACPEGCLLCGVLSRNPTDSAETDSRQKPCPS